METEAEYNRTGRALAARPRALGQRPPGVVASRPAAGLGRYAVTTNWGESRDGEFAETLIEKQLAVAIVPHADHLEVTVEWLAVPVLHKPEPMSFDEVTLLLAEVYRKVVLAVSPTGQMLALRNHAEVVSAWEAVKQKFGRYEGDTTIALLIQLLDSQVPDAQAVLASLQFDYFFALFLKSVCHQQSRTTPSSAQLAPFPQFFSDVKVVFWETMTLVPAAEGQPTACLVFAGQVAEAHTDRAAIAQAIALRLGVGPTPEPAALHFVYEATCVLEEATGLLLAFDATVACGQRPRYQKEYTLTVRRV